MTEYPDSYGDLRDQFTTECVLHALSRIEEDQDEAIVLFLNEQTGRIHRVLDATRGSPDSGWFVLALGDPNSRETFDRQFRIHDSDSHRVCIVEGNSDPKERNSSRDSFSSDEEA